MRPLGEGSGGGRSPRLQTDPTPYPSATASWRAARCDFLQQRILGLLVEGVVDRAADHVLEDPLLGEFAVLDLSRMAHISSTVSR